MMMETMVKSEKNVTMMATNDTFNGSLFDEWIAYLDCNKDSTKKSYTKAIKQFALYLDENGITQPQRADVLAYRAHLLNTRKATTAALYMAAVKLFFEWAELKGLYPNIALHIHGVTVSNEHKKDYLTSAQMQRLLASIDRSTLKGKRDYAMLALMATTGLRTISVANANIEDITLAGDSTVLYYNGKGKNGKDEYVKLAAQVDAAINDYLMARGKVDAGCPLFASISNRNSGGRVTTKTISLTVKEYLKAIGLDSDRLTAHSLRHTAATLNLLNGGSIEETQQLLGHSNINTTLIYAHALERAKNQSENRIADAIFA